MDEKGVHVDPTKIQFIHDWSSPKKLTKLQNFLGLAKFYYMFVLGFSHIYWALSQVTKFVWVASQHKSFEDLKFFLCSTLVLIPPELQQPFEIEADASNYAIGVVLTQHGHLVVYHSKHYLMLFLDTPSTMKRFTPLCKHVDSGSITL
jgi:hypothetical protein